MCLCSCFVLCMQFGLNYHALSDKGNMQGMLSRWLPDATANEVCCILLCGVCGWGVRRCLLWKRRWFVRIPGDAPAAVAV